MTDEAQVTDVEPTDEELEALEGDDEKEEPKAMAPEVTAIPPWASIPPNFKLPPGARPTFVLFRAKWTSRPERGDRWCMLLPLTEQDESTALRRCGDDKNKAVAEMARQTIRVLDGATADWSASPVKGNVRQFWRDIGPKCRKMVILNYHRTHNLSAEEQLDFVQNCIVEVALVQD